MCALEDRLATRRMSCDTSRSDTRGGEAIQCATRPARLATRPGSATTRQGTPETRPGDDYDTAPVRATTRPSARHVSCLSVVGVQLGLWVCIWCTQRSFGLSVLFSVTVWTTVHEHCSHDFSKKKIKNK